MTRIITEPRAFRLTRERTEEPKRVRGYALAIDFLNGYAADARVIEKTSAVLFPERIDLTEGNEGDRRRFGFVEYFGKGTPPRSGLVRHVGDAFFADRRTADFVWDAIIEKIDNDGAHLDRVASGFYRR